MGFGLDDWIYCTYTHGPELQSITAPQLISTIHKSPKHPLSLFQPAVSSPAVPWQRIYNSLTVITAHIKPSIHTLSLLFTG
jgi:hypothetical protein